MTHHPNPAEIRATLDTATRGELREVLVTIAAEALDADASGADVAAVVYESLAAVGVRVE